MHKSNHTQTHMKERLEQIKEWILDHAKVVMPLILVVCVLITVFIAVNANRKAALKEQQQIAETSAEASDESGVEKITVPEIPLEENAYPEINALLGRYYEAMASGDIDTVMSINNDVDDTEKIWVEEISQYIDSYSNIDIYTKPGLVEGSYVAYVYLEMKFKDYDQFVPGMQTLYVCTNAEGELYINEAEDSQSVNDYIKEVSLQDDVVDLNNKVAAAYNDLLASNEELNEFLADLTSRMNASVGEALARAEAPEMPAETPDADQPSGAEAEGAEDTPEEGGQDSDENTAPEENMIKTVRATDVVNIRSSDSETADKIGKAQVGDEFTLLETKENGWSKVSFEGKDAFIKSEFLETVSEQAADTSGQEDGAEEQASADTSTDDASSDASSNGTVTAKESVNIRATESETGEKLGLAYKGEKLELITKQADGWCKIRYKGQVAYVKSEYVE